MLSDYMFNRILNVTRLFLPFTILPSFGTLAPLSSKRPNRITGNHMACRANGYHRGIHGKDTRTNGLARTAQIIAKRHPTYPDDCRRCTGSLRRVARHARYPH